MSKDFGKERQELGAKGESIALDYLKEMGYKLVAKNYRCHRWGEIDLVMRDGKYLVFVEVRTKTNTVYGTPTETVDYKKRRQIEKMARLFLAREKIPEDTFCRFDIVGIVIGSDNIPIINYYKDAFIAGD